MCHWPQQYPARLSNLSIRNLTFDECLTLLDRCHFSPETEYMLKERVSQSLVAELPPHTVTHSCVSNDDICVCCCRGLCDKTMALQLDRIRASIHEPCLYRSIIEHLDRQAGRVIPRALCYVRRHVLRRYRHRAIEFDDFCYDSGYHCNEATLSENKALFFCKCEYCQLHNLKESRGYFRF